MIGFSTRETQANRLSGRSHRGVYAEEEETEGRRRRQQAAFLEARIRECHDYTASITLNWFITTARLTFIVDRGLRTGTPLQIKLNKLAYNLFIVGSYLRSFYTHLLTWACGFVVTGSCVVSTP